MNNSLIKICLLITVLIVVSCNQEKTPETSNNDETNPRSVLPLKEPTPPLYTELDVRYATPPPSFEVKAPEGAPNVVIVLIDDLGFAGTSKNMYYIVLMLKY